MHRVPPYAEPIPGEVASQGSPVHVLWQAQLTQGMQSVLPHAEPILEEVASQVFLTDSC